LRKNEERQEMSSEGAEGEQREREREREREQK
jgi:hypothetical protein